MIFLTMLTQRLFLVVAIDINRVLQERDVGLFSVLFRTKQSIDQYTVGVEFELYRCTLWLKPTKIEGYSNSHRIHGTNGILYLIN